ncbi:hypothetical protein AWC02_00115 [Mycolicibacter engbaekii]|uniref:Transmembrane protein n=1 Tax=Mycolicibacter engbaekii TaxID=188915 RepID=A0A1X1U4D5_9MYCO|nr:hypothetical protein AWC02_00115 [Mycolicibacter engbaekii]
MNAVAGTVQKVAGAANRAVTMTTEAAGAIGGAAINGAIGGVKGAASGVQQGLRSGSHSTAAAGLTLGALGVAGLVEWPVLVAVGGTALVLRQLTNRSHNGQAPAAPARSLKVAQAPKAAEKPAAKPTEKPAAKPAVKSVAKPAEKSAAKPTGASTRSRRSPAPKKTAARQTRSAAAGNRTRTRH